MNEHPIGSYEDLRVWQFGLDLADKVFQLTRPFPPDGWGLAAQMRKAAVSVPSNIAEGWGRNSRREFLRFLTIARGSLFEVRTQVEIAKRAGFVSADRARRLTDDIDALSRMLLTYIRAIRARQSE
jgi:four helix bundle protein